jgi:transposase
MMYSLIGTARLNAVDPLAWLTDVLVRIADLPEFRLHELLPWEWIRFVKRRSCKRLSHD